jgi:hypothetical protein
MAASHNAHNQEARVQIHEEENNVENAIKTAHIAVQAAHDVVLQAEKNLKIAKKEEHRKKNHAQHLAQKFKENSELETQLDAAKEALKQAEINTRLAQKSLDKAEEKSKLANAQFTQHMPNLYRRNFAIKLAALIITVSASSVYQFKMGIKSVNEVAEVWDFDQPSTDISTPVGIAVTSVDTIFNALLYSASVEALKTSVEYFSKHGTAGISLAEIFIDPFKFAFKQPRQAFINLLHIFTQKVHNYANGAQFVIALDEWLEPAMHSWKWAVYLPILHFSDIFYRNSQDSKYLKGAAVFNSQMKTLFEKTFHEGEIIRSTDLIIRGVLAGGVLRGLNFYFIADTFSKMSPATAWIDPSVVGLATFWHAICVRFTKSFRESGFAKQNELRDRFVELLAEEKFQELKSKFPDMPESRCKLLALMQAAGTQALFNDHIPQDARISDEAIAKVSKKVLREKAQLISKQYSAAQKKFIKSEMSYREHLTNFIGNMPIAMARAALAAAVSSSLTSYSQTVLTTLGVSDEDAALAANYVVPPMMGLFAATLYQVTSVRNLLDARVLERFDQTNPTINASLIDQEEIEAAANIEPAPASFSGKVKNAFNFNNVSRWGGHGITVMAGVSRVASQVYTSAKPMIDFGLNKKIALTSSTLLASEQVLNSVDVFSLDVQRTLRGYLKPKSENSSAPSASIFRFFNCCKKTDALEEKLLNIDDNVQHRAP